MKLVWAVVGVLYALLNIYVGSLMVAAGTSERLAQKGFLLQAPPVLGGLALAIFAIPLIWTSVRLVTARPPTH